MGHRYRRRDDLIDQRLRASGGDALPRWLLSRQDCRERGLAGGEGDEVAAAVEPCGVFVGRVDDEAADSDLLAHGSAGAPGVFDERSAEAVPLGAGGDGETGEQDGGGRGPACRGETGRPMPVAASAR